MKKFLKDQQLNIEKKVELSKKIICEWYEKCHGKVFVSFSGGKDSTVLLYLVRSLYPEVPAVFLDTQMEYPEIYEFVDKVPNLVRLKTNYTIEDVIYNHGYCLINKKTAKLIERVRKRGCEFVTENEKKICKKYDYLINSDIPISDKCCKLIKGDILKDYIKTSGRYPYIGVMSTETMTRTRMFINNGYINSATGINSAFPLAFWKESEVVEFIKKSEISYSKIYGDFEGEYEIHTNCMYCLYGIEAEKSPNRFERMKHTHPYQYKYAMDVLKINKVLQYMNIPY